jgi:transposase-like protein
VIGEALLAGEGYRLVAERIGVPAETVRDWRRRFRSRADTVAAHFLRWAVMRFADEPAERVKRPPDHPIRTR